VTPLRLALVPGEPAGVGPGLCVHLAQRPRTHALIVHADSHVMAEAARRAGLALTFVDPADPGATRPGVLGLHAIRAVHPVRPGHLDVANAPSVIKALQTAARGCLDGDYDGLVTGPVHKAIVNEAGIPYSGTTELLAAQAGCDVVMMLGHDDLRVALVTTHLPLRAVPDAITAQAVERTLRIVDAALRRDFGIAAPHIAVLGLNPHAGEDGHLGREEITVIAPAMAALRDEGIDLVGPLPADTAFLPARLAGFDAVVAMYHDQGLPVLKYSGFERAVNITLGLPYPRVAVDHGTALDLAESGTADPSSLFAADALCARLAANRRSARA
jgi:4-hydroxythreonine-4-phosphate dehydrogenase